MIVAPNSTDVTTYFKLVDPATFTPETGLVITDLDATYIRDRVAASKTDLTALAAVNSAHADNKAIEVDAANAPGVYRVDWPDAAFASGSARVQLVVNGAAIDPAVIEVELAPWLTTVTGATVLADLKSIDGAATNGNNAVLNLKQLNIQADANLPAVVAYGSGTGYGMDVLGGATASGLRIFGGVTSGNGIYVRALGAGNGIDAEAAFGNGLLFKGGALFTNAGVMIDGGAGRGAYITGERQGVLIEGSQAGAYGIEISSISDGIHIEAGADGVDITADGYDIKSDMHGTVDGNATAIDMATALARLGAWTGTGINTILGALRALAAKAAALTPTDISTGTTFDNTTDSQEAIRDALGGASLTAQEVRDAMKLAPTAGAPAAGSIDDHLDDMPTDVWAAATRTLTSSAAATAAAVAGSSITIVRGDSASIALTGLGNISTRTKLWFTVKDNYSDPDTSSIIQIVKRVPADLVNDGLIYLNSALADTKANGSITVTNEVTGALTIELDEVETAKLTVASGLLYDIQMKTATTIQTLTIGSFAISDDVTRATS